MVRRVSFLSLLGAVALTVVAPGVAAGGGCHAPADLALTSSEKTQVGIAGCAFVDTVTYADPGEDVTWVNEDYVPHSVSGAAGSWGDEYLIDRGETVTYRFDESGVYPYYCVLHPSMVGAVVVGDAPGPAALKDGKAAVEGGQGAALAASAQEPPTDPDEGSPAGTAALAGAAALAALALGARFRVRRRTA